ncbi:MAG: VWA domain-containing protein [Pyrinomonadaceae bacterium]
MYFTSHLISLRSLLPCLAILCLATAQFGVYGQGTQQQQQQRAQDDAEDVLRVSTRIVQTDVSVVDKKGQFVEGLQRDQFELKVEGKPQQVLFFERITAGGASEAARIAAARGETAPAAGAGVSSVPRDYGRTVIFFIDDLHLSPEGINRAKELLRNFVEKEMTPNMQVLVASPGGQLGFLQQFTNDRAVVRAAIGRLKYLSQALLDQERPAMSGYQAEAIDRGDRQMLAYIVEQTLEETGQSQAPEVRKYVEMQVQQRARRIRRQAALLNGGTITALESVVRVRSPLGGRQTLFYISEGFIRDNSESDLTAKMQRVADAAARTGTVIYTLFARGLAVGMLDASSGARADIMSESGGLDAYNPAAELSASQEVLRDLAADTGGRAIINTNALESAVAKTLDETANYYLLAWRPEGLDVTGGAPKFRKLEISIKGRPDLTVRVRRGFNNAAPERATQVATATPKTAPAAAPSSTNAALNGALNSLNPRRELPVDAYAVFTSDAQAGSVINASVQLANDRLKFAPVGGKQQAQVEVGYVLFDDKGKVVHSSGRTLAVDGAGGSRGKLVTNFSVPVPAPGIYQFRAAARDANSGLVGSAFEWVEAPDVKAKGLALSGLLVTERRRANAAPANGAAANQVPDILRVERRFARSSRIFLQLYIYNAARAAGGAPDVEMEIKVLNAGRVVLNAPPHKVAPAGASDLARIFYAAEVPLANMPPGVYLLQVTATDRLGRTNATRELDFTVE